ncbi:MAG: PGF-CTERM sorting domain-containing protein, partial [Halobacteriota archaeon]|nr:PGF-CTERM sorting domain-containing protein [Halobacteriota archaeon]
TDDGARNHRTQQVCRHRLLPYQQFRGYSSEPRFPPGSTVYIYVEATGKAKEDTKTGQYKPNIKFDMEGTRVKTGGKFSASTTSDKRTNDDISPYKKAYGVISYKIDEDSIEGRYSIKIIAKDLNDGGNIVGRGPYLAFYVDKNASLYPSYKFEYSDLNITPNPAELGQTVTVSLNVTNTGGKGDLKGEDVDLTINGIKTLTKNVHLVDDETKMIEFKLTKDQLNETGDYSIRVEDLRETLSIEEPKEDENQPTGAPSNRRRDRLIPGFEVIYAASSIAIVAYLLVKRERR